MDKKAVLSQIQQMGITEKIAKLSETDATQMKNRVEQAALDEQKPPLKAVNTEKTLSVYADTE